MVQSNIIQDRLQELFPIHYRNGNVLMINADCMEVMKHIKDKEIDLSCVDPPYGINIGNKINSITGGVKHKPKDWDKYPITQEYFDGLFRISKNQIIWGGNYFISKIKRDSYCWIFWDKNNGDSLFADGELAWTSFNTPVRIAKIHWCGSAAKWETGANKIHPTQKPVALYRWLLQNYAKPGDKIIDTHSGSGSCACACHLEKFDFLAIEKDEDYYKASVERLETLRSQGVLF